MLLRRWRLVLGIPAVLFVFTATTSLLFRHRRWIAESKFAPQLAPASQSQQLVGLAAQFGISVGGGGGGTETLDFYAELLRSRELLREAILTRYRVPCPAGIADTAGRNLIQLLQIPGESQDEQVRRAVLLLRVGVSVSTGVKTGLITIRTSSRCPDLAVQLNRRLLDLVNQFNLHKRQSQAASERRFVEARMQEAQRDLSEAEAGLERFLSQNRSYASSPQLAFVARRLERRVELRQQVYTSLAQAYERSRIDEVRNTPVITILDPPEGSLDRVGRGTVLRSLVSLVFGGMLGIVTALLAEYLGRQRRDKPEEFEELFGRANRLAARLIPGRRRARAAV
ncbi:MAG: hypothetical protein HY560_06810 [Gemmatimonadetes bacterium]|nr:hypothetical protein [Gemmatimonadota bacterium]